MGASVCCVGVDVERGVAGAGPEGEERRGGEANAKIVGLLTDSYKANGILTQSLPAPFPAIRTLLSPLRRCSSERECGACGG